jgi:hypothetical protein
MKRPLLLLALIATFAAPARAATLNELNGPLLNKGQWDLDALTYTSYVTDKTRETSAGGPGGKSDSDSTQVSLSPEASYGLTDKLTLLVRESYVIPYTVAYKHYLLPGGPDAYFKSKFLASNTLSSSLTWRPNDPWQFLFSGSGSYLGLDQERGSLTGSGSVLTQEQQNHNTSLTAQATWLSKPKAGPRTANNRADLDGLLNPLLNRGQAEAVVGLNYSRNYAHPNGALLMSPASLLQNARTTAGQLVASPSFSYGILENLQAQAAANITIPNATSTLARSRSINTNSVGVTTYSSARTKYRTLAEYFPSLTLTHRLTPQLQWYMNGSYSYSKTGQRGYTVNENTGAVSPNSAVSGYERASVGAAADWISAPRSEGRPLASDLDGLERPLLERGQFKAEVSYSTGKQRFWTAGMPAQPGQTSSVYYSELSYGVRDALQAFASLQLEPGYSDKSSFYKYTYPAVKTYGAGLTWRPRQTFQVVAETSVTPRVTKSENYDTGGAVSSTVKDEENTYTVNLSATWLW